MKFLPIFLSLSLASVALAQEPAELTNARAMYELNLAKAKKQLESDYHKLMRDSLSSHILILESYKKDAMQAGKLEEAVAYDKEIEKAKDLYSKQKEKSSSAKQQSDEEAFLEGAWDVRDLENNSWGIRVFKGKQWKAFSGGKWVSIWDYSVKDGIVTITWGKDGKGWDKHTIDMKNPNQMHVVNSNGAKAIATRLKW